MCDGHLILTYIPDQSISNFTNEILTLANSNWRLVNSLISFKIIIKNAANIKDSILEDK